MLEDARQNTPPPPQKTFLMEKLLPWTIVYGLILAILLLFGA